MKTTILALAFFCLCSLSALAQSTYGVKGIAIDSAVLLKLPNTTISILNAKDSVLRKFTRAGADGSFTLNGLTKGKFIALITYPGYADYVEHFTLDSAHTTKNFGGVSLLLKSRLLKEVIIKGEVAAIKIKGDTTEYNAKAFKIQPNSKVEDLLKQLPGIQVDKDGKITAQGQAVPKVLVDGEEFFGDDPTLVTKNLRADMVDKVQLYDKKSDQATFTGIDDGEKTKTINIKLKEDKKNGYFGKLDGGIGTNKYYQGQALYNKFKGKKKFSLYGTLSNTGKTGLGWDDSRNLGTSTMQTSDEGFMYYSGGGDEFEGWGGRYNGDGIPIARTAGAHYDDKWKNDKYTLNANYKIGSLAVDGTRSTATQQNLPTTVLKSQADETFDNYVFRQKLDAAYTIKLDTTSNLKITFDGTLKNSTTRTNSQTATRRQDSTLINSNGRELTNDVDQQLYNASLFYTKKLKKVGRTISWAVNAGVTESKSTGFLKSRLELYDTNSQLDSTQVIDQLKTSTAKTSRFSTNVTYTEPLSKVISLVLSYGFSANGSNTDRKSFDQSAPGVYNILNDSLSNHYVFNQTSNRGGLNFAIKKGKSNIRFGTGVANVDYKQVDEINDVTRRRNFTNWSPQFSYQFRISQNSSTNFNYNGNQTQPTIDQLQPIRVNTDPLNITLGNPNLKPSFTHSFNTFYNSYKVISGQSVWLNGSYRYTVNPIVDNTITDTVLAKSTTQYVNLPNQRNSSFWFSVDYNQKVFGIDMGLRPNIDGSVSYSLINNELNRTRAFTYGAQFTIRKYVQKKFESYFAFGPTYTINEASQQPNRNNNGRGWTGYYSFSVFLPGKINIGSDGNYQYNAATKSFATDFSQFIVNASITKSFFKSESLKLQLRGNDLLNQNTGFSRNASASYYTESRVTTIRRYFMAAVTWDFNGFAGVAKK